MWGSEVRWSASTRIAPVGPRSRSASCASALEGGTVGQADCHSACRAAVDRLVERCDGLRGYAQTQVDPMSGELVGQQGCELGVHRRQDVVGQLDEVDLKAARGERLDRFEADEAGTDD